MCVSIRRTSSFTSTSRRPLPIKWFFPYALYISWGRDTLGKFSAIFYKGDNFCYFLFVSCIPNPFCKRSTLKGKNLLQRGANSFLLCRPLFRRKKNNYERVVPMKLYLFACWSKVSPFRQGQNKFDRVVSLESVFIRLLEQILPFQK